jgi:hypothetical protein
MEGDKSTGKRIISAQEKKIEKFNSVSEKEFDSLGEIKGVKREQKSRRENGK